MIVAEPSKMRGQMRETPSFFLASLCPTTSLLLLRDECFLFGAEGSLTARPVRTREKCRNVAPQGQQSRHIPGLRCIPDAVNKNKGFNWHRIRLRNSPKGPVIPYSHWACGGIGVRSASMRASSLFERLLKSRAAGGLPFSVVGQLYYVSTFPLS
jgi:hypothetical protein